MAKQKPIMIKKKNQGKFTDWAKKMTGHAYSGDHGMSYHHNVHEHLGSLIRK